MLSHFKDLSLKYLRQEYSHTQILWYFLWLKRHFRMSLGHSLNSRGTISEEAGLGEVDSSRVAAMQGERLRS